MDDHERAGAPVSCVQIPPELDEPKIAPATDDELPPTTAANRAPSDDEAADVSCPDTGRLCGIQVAPPSAESHALPSLAVAINRVPSDEHATADQTRELEVRCSQLVPELVDVQMP